jgi:ribonuclease D
MSVITNNKDLISFCEKLEGKKFITVDTEFTREKTYYPHLCLLQISDGINSAAFDPLEDIDLSPIFQIFFDDSVVKVFHSGKQDLEIIYNITGQIPQNIFDTQIAASICGYGEQVSYKNLVSELLGLELDKTEQYTDWASRPLSKKQIFYALSDVTHLVEIYKILHAKLAQLGRESLHRSETEALLSEENFKIDTNKAWLKIKFKQTSKKFVYSVAKLAAWRELKARELNIPRLHLMSDRVLLATASSFQSKTRKLDARSLNFFQEYEQELLTIKSDIDSSKDYIIDYPKAEYKSKRDSALIYMLRLLLKIKATEYGVAERIIASTKDLEDFSNNINSRIMRDWQYNVFGKDAENLKNGKIAVCYKDEQIKIIEIG